MDSPNVIEALPRPGIKTRRPWFSADQKPPPHNTVVETKIDDWEGARNFRRLRRYHRVWLHEDGSSMVYYVPTHWRAIR